jgi:hypothetical protein
MQYLLLGLAALACPIGMGLMMLMTARGMRSGGPRAADPAARRELAGLRAEVALLKGGRPVETRRG